ncbi:MAG: dihydroneopterin aldolase [Candidatus Lokiarchaeota archaeon]|nr:dihydroneopterin aldolase [Candidatus Lokiarchaeota archaeon]MBD3341146.1 dihydroneopterin aldolase [Candidatus Lokiarchaeota archaeon]
MNQNPKIFFDPSISDRERISFEAGIKLGALYHILCGMPISSNDEIIHAIERGIEASISCQPYVKSVKVFLNKSNIIGDKNSEFDYDEITGKIIRAELTLEYQFVEITAKIDWIEDMKYPLMYIEKISERH